VWPRLPCNAIIVGIIPAAGHIIKGTWTHARNWRETENLYLGSLGIPDISLSSRMMGRLHGSIEAQKRLHLPATRPSVPCPMQPPLSPTDDPVWMASLFSRATSVGRRRFCSRGCILARIWNANPGPSSWTESEPLVHARVGQQCSLLTLARPRNAPTGDNGWSSAR